MKFTRLRLSGFKSFVDPTELIIEPGLSGVVGPNGCGKSNLLEAMRWVMGENRPTSMRGSGMDDVIFGGTGSRPMRNNAEVTLFIDNSDRGVLPASELVLTVQHADGGREIVKGVEPVSVPRIRGRRSKVVEVTFVDDSGAAGELVVSEHQHHPSEHRPVVELPARNRDCRRARGAHAAVEPPPRPTGAVIFQGTLAKRRPAVRSSAS